MRQSDIESKKEIISEISSRNYIHHMPFYFYTICLQSPTKIKSELHVWLKSIVRGPLNNISLSIDKELGKSKVSLLYHISMEIFRGGLIIRFWRFLIETTMVYSWIFLRYLPEKLLWFSTIKPLKVSSRGLCKKIFTNFSVPKEFFNSRINKLMRNSYVFSQ